jgi:LysR family glycine cleavage system transcriptional activator
MPGTTHLRALQALELALRTGSMKAAAQELAISPAAVGQRIRALEDYLGYDLLVRGRSGLRPTRELDAAMAHLGAAFRELRTVSQILDFQRVEEIHITADPDLAELWLRPRLEAFRAENPNLLFCLNGIGDVPMRLGDADCEIWFGGDREGVEAQALFRDYLVPVSSPANTVRISKLPEESRLEGFPLLHLDRYTVDAHEMGWKEWIRQYGHRRTAPDRGIRYKRVQHALKAVYANAGLMICGLSLVLSEVEAGNLSLPFEVGKGGWTGAGYQVAFRPDRLRRASVDRFRNWLLKQAGDTLERLHARVDAA